MWIACSVLGDLDVTLGWMMPGSFNSPAQLGLSFVKVVPTLGRWGWTQLSDPQRTSFPYSPSRHFIWFLSTLTRLVNLATCVQMQYLASSRCPPVQTQKSLTPARDYVAHVAVAVPCTRQEIHIAFAPSLSFHKRLYHPHCTAEEAGLSAASQVPADLKFKSRAD